MKYEDFRRDLAKYSNDEECVMAIHRCDENTRYNFKADETGMYSSLWHNPLNDGFVSWKKVKTMIEKGEWENYPRGKRTIMRMGSEEYIIEAYFLSDIN